MSFPSDLFALCEKDQPTRYKNWLDSWKATVYTPLFLKITLS
jgi:hypothetical protein